MIQYICHTHTHTRNMYMLIATTKNQKIPAKHRLAKKKVKNLYTMGACRVCSIDGIRMKNIPLPKWSRLQLVCVEVAATRSISIPCPGMSCIINLVSVSVYACLPPHIMGIVYCEAHCTLSPPPISSSSSSVAPLARRSPSCDGSTFSSA